MPPVERFLDPKVLAGVSGLELIAKTVVKGFVAGLHRSPDFGFSQEFAEYRAYTPGDDLRHVDWNVFARTEKMFLKRYRGETNSQLTVLLDASASMGYGGGNERGAGIKKIDYARYLAASLCYLAGEQRDAAGLIVFDDEIRGYVSPSSRQGQLARLLHTLNEAEPGKRTDYALPFQHFQQFMKRRGMAVVISDFYEQPETIIRTIEPLRHRGNDVVLFHILDPRELDPKLRESSILIDMETNEAMQVTPEYSRSEYKTKIDAHIDALREKARGAGLDYYLHRTDRPLDETLREYLAVRKGRL